MKALKVCESSEIIKTDKESEEIPLKYDRIHITEGQASPDELMDILGEIIDNARSAAEARQLYFKIDIFIEEIEKDGKIMVIIKDESGGIDESDFKEIFSPGYSGEKNRGFLNNFGIGMKKTFFICQYHMNTKNGCVEPKNNWYVATATDDDIKNNKYRIMNGPLIDVVKIETKDNNERFKKPGTEVGILFDKELYPLFNKLPMKKGGKATFLRRIYRLHEQIAWCHGPALSVRGNITIFHKAFGQTDYTTEKIYPLHPVFQDNRDTKVPEQMGSRDIYFSITYDNKTYRFKYTYGILKTPSSVEKTVNANKDPNKHIYPLTKYDKNPGSAGVDIIIGGPYGKRICRLSLKNVFDIGTSKLEYESYHAYLTCPPDLPTSCLHYIKKKVNQWNPIMQNLLDKIKESTVITPEYTCKSTPEKEIHSKLKPILEKTGNVIHEMPVNDQMEGLDGRKALTVDFMVENHAGFYQIIEVAKCLDLEHIYKLDSYKKFIEAGLCSRIKWNIDEGEKPKIEYILITPDPSDAFILQYVLIYGFDWKPLAEYNINESEIK